MVCFAPIHYCTPSSQISHRTLVVERETCFRINLLSFRKLVEVFRQIVGFLRCDCTSKLLLPSVTRAVIEESSRIPWAVAGNLASREEASPITKMLSRTFPSVPTGLKLLLTLRECVFSSCSRSLMLSMRGFGARPVDQTSNPK